MKDTSVADRGEQAVPAPAFDNLTDAVDHAWEAHRREDWAGALARWTMVRERWTDYPPPFVHCATALENLGRDDEAVSMLLNAFERFSTNSEVVIKYALILAKHARIDASTAVLAGAVSRFPTVPQVGVLYLKEAFDGHDYQEVVRRGELVLRQYPTLFETNDGVRHFLSVARFHERANALHVEPAEGSRERRAEQRIGAPDTNEQLMHAFESLGENCEFGLAQRFFGTESLGLLCFAATKRPALIEALNHRFEGVGQSEFTLISEEVHAGESDEYRILDTRYRMWAHTYVKTDRSREGEIRQMLLQRTQYLARKLIEDLEDAEKIFVFHSHCTRDEAGDIDALHAAIRAYGPNHVLYAFNTSDPRLLGTVERHDEGIMIAYVDALDSANKLRPATTAMPFQRWREVCRKAHALRFNY